MLILGLLSTYCTILKSLCINHANLHWRLSNFTFVYFYLIIIKLLYFTQQHIVLSASQNPGQWLICDKNISRSGKRQKEKEHITTYHQSACVRHNCKSDCLHKFAKYNTNQFSIFHSFFIKVGTTIQNRWEKICMYKALYLHLGLLRDYRTLQDTSVAYWAMQSHDWQKKRTEEIRNGQG